MAVDALSGPMAPDARAHATVVCALGMHRSGTSLVARMLNLLGVHLGPEPRVLTSGKDNPTGYWEYRPFVDINDAILERFGGQWDQPPAFPSSWPGDERLVDLREKARELLTTDFAAAPLWGWKDPRTCLTLPFWQDVIGPMRYVICLRNPCAVVASLAHRESTMSRSMMSGEKAEQLWLAHVQVTLAHTSGQPRMFVFYEDIMDDWLQELRRMASFIGNPARADDSRVQDDVGAFLQQELCHHRMSTKDLLADPRLSLPTKALWLALSAETHAFTLRDRQTLEEIHASSAWKLVTFVRGLIVDLLPAGTRRRRAFNTVLWSLARRLPSPHGQNLIVHLHARLTRQL
jgi:hypothetical protein